MSDNSKVCTECGLPIEDDRDALGTYVGPPPRQVVYAHWSTCSLLAQYPSLVVPGEPVAISLARISYVNAGFGAFAQWEWCGAHNCGDCPAGFLHADARSIALDLVIAEAHRFPAPATV